MPTPAPEDGKNVVVKLHAVGDDVEFVFLEMCSVIIYLDSASMAAEKVYTLVLGDGDSFRKEAIARL